MVGARSRPSGGALNVQRGAKGRNFCKEKEEQLCKSVFHIIQDRITEIFLRLYKKIATGPK